MTMLSDIADKIQEVTDMAVRRIENGEQPRLPVQWLALQVMKLMDPDKIREAEY